MDFKRNKNTDFMFNTLTSDKITKMSNGRIPKMSPEAAAGLIGSWIVETGDPTLTNLDVVEKQAKAGRGLSQYTGTRRIPYDKARYNALQTGVDPNSAEWQMQYFADEYSGKYDQDGRSLIGWTRALENLKPGMKAADYAEQITGSAAAGKGYFRPGVPHTDRRRAAAEAVFQAYGVRPPTPEATTLSIPQIKQGPPVQQQQSNPLSIVGDMFKNVFKIP